MQWLQKKKIKKKLKKNINHKTNATTSEAALSSALPLPYFLCFLQFFFCSCARRLLCGQSSRNIIQLQANPVAPGAKSCERVESVSVSCIFIFDFGARPTSSSFADSRDRNYSTRMQAALISMSIFN